MFLLIRCMYAAKNFSQGWQVLFEITKKKARDLSATNTDA